MAIFSVIRESGGKISLSVGRTQGTGGERKGKGAPPRCRRRSPFATVAFNDILKLISVAYSSFSPFFLFNYRRGEPHRLHTLSEAAEHLAAIRNRSGDAPTSSLMDQKVRERETRLNNSSPRHIIDGSLAPSIRAPGRRPPLRHRNRPRLAERDLTSYDIWTYLKFITACYERPAS